MNRANTFSLWILCLISKGVVLVCETRENAKMLIVVLNLLMKGNIEYSQAENQIKTPALHHTRGLLSPWIKALLDVNQERTSCQKHRQTCPQIEKNCFVWEKNNPSAACARTAGWGVYFRFWLHNQENPAISPKQSYHTTRITPE